MPEEPNEMSDLLIQQNTTKNAYRQTTQFTPKGFLQLLNTQNIGSIISSTIFALILTIIDTLTYGKRILTFKEDTLLVIISMNIYLYTTIVSQIIFNIFTKMDTGIMSSATVDNYFISRQIFNLLNTTDNIHFGITNTLISFSLSTMLLAIILILVSQTVLIEYLKYLPKPTIIGALLVMGLVQIHTGWIMVNESYTNIILSIIMVAVLYILEEKYPKNPFILTIVCISSTFLFYLIMFILNIIFNKRVEVYGVWEYALKFGMTNEQTHIKLTPFFMFENIKVRLINIKSILGVIHHIISIAVFSSFQFAVSYPSYRDLTGKVFSFRDEVRVQGYSNIASAFVFYPTSFIPSYSFGLLKSGGLTRYHGIITALFFLFIPFTLSILNSFIPRFVLGAIPILLGMYYIVPVCKATRDAHVKEYILSIITGCIIYGSGFPIVGIIVSLLVSYTFYFIKVRGNGEEIADDQYIIRPKVLCFMNMKDFISKIESKDEVVIDFTFCLEIDWLVREYIIKRVKEGDKKYIFIGRCKSFFNFKKACRENVKTYKCMEEYIINER